MSSNERQILRDLARQVAEIAASAENEQVHRRWRDVNGLRKPDRAPVYCRPVGAWAEILPEESLQCTDPWLRSIERDFRMAIIKREIGDDTPVEPYFSVTARFDVEPAHTWGVEIGQHAPSGPGGAWAYDPPLKSVEDFDKLRLPTFIYNDAKTQEGMSRANDLLGDILPVKRVCDAPLSPDLSSIAAYLRGLSEIMMDMIAEPELMHRLMGHVRDGVLKAMDEVEAAGVLTPNNTGPMICSDPIGDTSGGVTYGNMWVMANSQECDQVSPDMWEEFCLAYQKPLFERFGLVAYGCCENLTHKIDGVLSIPNLRIFVCSAWTDLNRVLEKVSSDYVIMWRQKASDVVFAEDVDTLRRDLDEGMRKLQGRPVQIVLRELQTLAGHPDRLHVWTKLAKEVAKKYA